MSVSTPHPPNEPERSPATQQRRRRLLWAGSGGGLTLVTFCLGLTADSLQVLDTGKPLIDLVEPSWSSLGLWLLLLVPCLAIGAIVLWAVRQRDRVSSSDAPPQTEQTSAQSSPGTATRAPSLPALAFPSQRPSRLLQRIQSWFRQDGRRERPSALFGDEPHWRRLSTLLAQRQILALTGPRGAGTSTWAWQIAQLFIREHHRELVYLDLRGPALGSALSADQARRSLRIEALRTLGLPDRGDVHQSLTDALGGRRVLFVLDNVDKAAQVSWLAHELPDGCYALIAGPCDGPLDARVERSRLPRRSASDALGLLERISGDPVSSHQRSAAARLVRLCGHLPLAIEIIGNLIRIYRWTPDDLVAAWRSVSSAYPASDPCRPLWCAADIACREIDTMHAAALVGSRPETVQRALARLAGLGLVAPIPGYSDRYRIPQSLMQAARRWLDDESPRYRRRAVNRLIRRATRTAQGYAAVFNPRERSARAIPTASPPVDDLQEASAWFTRHHFLLRHMLTLLLDRSTGPVEYQAASRRWLSRLAVALAVWYAAERRLSDWRVLCGAIRDHGPDELHAWAYNELGVIARLRGDLDSALSYFSAAQTRRRVRHRGQEAALAQVETNLGVVELSRGNHAIALALLEEPQHRRQDRYGEAVTCLARAAAALLAGDRTGLAEQLLNRAAELAKVLGDTRLYAATLHNLGLLYQARGERNHGESLCEQAARLDPEGSYLDGAVPLVTRRVEAVR